MGKRVGVTASAVKDALIEDPEDDPEDNSEDNPEDDQEDTE